MESRYGHRTISHGGGMPGVSTSLTLIPSARLVVAGLANTTTTLPQQVTHRVLEAMLPAYRQWSAPTRSPQRTFARDRRTPGRRMVGIWTGHIESDQRGISIR